MALGNIERGRKKFADCTTTYSQGIDILPKETDKNTWVYYYYRGICEERDKQWNKAEADMRKALDLQPSAGIYQNQSTALAALAVAPVLFDAYQLNAEQTIMPDVLFEALVVAGIVLLLWRPRPALPFVVLGGLALGTSAPVRQVGEALILPALVYVLTATQGWRARLLNGVALTVCFALPVVDSDALVARYASLGALMRDLRAFGAANALHLRSRRPLRRAVLARAAQVYAERFADPDGRLRASFETIWLTGWAPHASQPKPLKPGSAAMRLADALKSAPDDHAK